MKQIIATAIMLMTVQLMAMGQEKVFDYTITLKNGEVVKTVDEYFETKSALLKNTINAIIVKVDGEPRKFEAEDIDHLIMVNMDDTEDKRLFLPAYLKTMTKDRSKTLVPIVFAGKYGYVGMLQFKVIAKNYSYMQYQYYYMKMDDPDQIMSCYAILTDNNTKYIGLMKTVKRAFKSFPSVTKAIDDEIISKEMFLEDPLSPAKYLEEFGPEVEK
ncbi:MAG: hypothetical protein MJZ13_08295 [Bacteroidales bacterium]|nr:hypothetical protein [Bacteroidales bacterium]